MRFPDQWDQVQQKPGSIQLVSKDQAATVLCSTYPVTDLPNVHNLEDYIRHDRKLLAGTKILSEQRTTLDGDRAIEFIFIVPMQPPLEVIEVTSVRKGMTYGLTLNSSPEAIEKYRADFNAIAKSFHVEEH